MVSTETEEKFLVLCSESFKVRSPLKNEEDELKKQIATLEATVEGMAETEKKLRSEIEQLRSQLQAARKENTTLNKCVQKTEFDKVSGGECVSKLRPAMLPFS